MKKMDEKESDISNEERILNNLRRIEKHTFGIKIGIYIIAMCALIPSIFWILNLLIRFLVEPNLPF